LFPNGQDGGKALVALEGLQDKVAVVTGAAGGIGSAVALRLSQEGARIALVDVDGDAADRTAAALPGEALAVAADVSTEPGVDAYMNAAIQRFGRIDAVHLNAGYAGRLVPLVDSDAEDFDRVMAVNVRGIYLGLRTAIRRMLEQDSGGSIVVTSSGLGLRGGQLWGPYAASKHAVLGLMRSASLEHARDGIRVNAVCPGFVDTAMVRPTEDMVDGDDRSAARAALENLVPLGRYARPAELAGLVAWLLSSESSYTTGGYYTADGGVDAAAAGYVPPVA
jgi:NAD(P)-dependent dehydrogenase (short-subunit alcohol dehydrogenase family)